MSRPKHGFIEVVMKFWLKKMWVEKHFWSQNVGVKENFEPKKFVSEKIFGPQTNILIQKYLFGPKNQFSNCLSLSSHNFDT